MPDGVAAQFDLIEFFGDIIPGTVLLVGLAAPLRLSIPTEFPTIAGFTLVAILAFLVGMTIPVPLGVAHKIVRNAYHGLRVGSSRSESARSPSRVRQGHVGGKGGTSQRWSAFG